MGASRTLLDSSSRKKILDFIRPLEPGLDGARNFGQVDARLARVERLREGESGIDEDLLFLLAVFFDRSKWLGRMGHESRTRIFLEGVGLAPDRVRAFLKALARVETAPTTLEEKLVWDADRLEKIGAIGILQAVVDAHRERFEIAEIADHFVREQEAIPFHTEGGRRVSAERLQTVRQFSDALRRELREQTPEA